MRVLNLAAGVLVALLISQASPASESSTEETSLLPATKEGVQEKSAQPIAHRFSFDEIDAEALVGDASIRPIGPTKMHFVGLPRSNRALLLDGKGDYVRVRENGQTGELDFDRGDELSIEAWVRLDEIRSGQNAYIVGKGRTHLGEAKDNQNYALRLRAVGQEACVSFLFRSVATEDEVSDWHRWTTKQGFRADGEWHHVAISYAFGNPRTIRGFIDGRSIAGNWDMGGATTRAPIVDDDELWIGSSMGGSASSSLKGAIDEVVIHRRIVQPSEMADRRVVIQRSPSPAAGGLAPGVVTVMLREDIGSSSVWPVEVGEPMMQYQQDAFGFSRVPTPYGVGGVRRDWNGTVMLTAMATVDLPAEEIEWMLRAGGLSRLWIGDDLVAKTPPRPAGSGGHGKVVRYFQEDPWLRPPRVGNAESIASHRVTQGGPVKIALETMIGGDDLRIEPGEIIVAYRGKGDPQWQVLSLIDPIPLTDEGWQRYADRLESHVQRIDDRQRSHAASVEDGYWATRHARAREFAGSLPRFKRDSIDQFVDARIEAAKQEGIDAHVSRPLQDHAFMRRLYLDCTGVVPTVEEMEQLRAMRGGRGAWIEHLLDDPRWADHWAAYWMDVLAENPNVLKASLNNSGPFRWYLYDVMRDNVAVDRWVTGLIRMEGSERYGGPAGFGIATENDVPMAAKAHVLGSAFLAINMKCARCHDAPYHDWTQLDLFSMAAMLGKKPLAVPITSSVPESFFEGESEEESLITVTLRPGQEVVPRWTLGAHTTDEALDDAFLGRADNPRERLAYHFTRPENQRFAETIVNRLWARLMGEAIVDPVDDWEGASPSHPDLLAFLARELTANEYNLKHVARLILNSHAYQRAAVDRDVIRDHRERLFTSPRQRRMTAEQLVDSLHVAVGRPMDSDELTFDPEARLKARTHGNLGRARRAWQLASLSNERDRPALSLPRAAAVCECLEAFGWKGTRQEPINHRHNDANVLQPGILSSGLLTIQLTRLTDGHTLTDICIKAESPDELVEHLFQRFLGRVPTEAEQHRFGDLLAEGFEERVLKTSVMPETPLREPPVTWANHLNPEATEIRLRETDRLREGPVPSGRLAAKWRERAEDAVWALINTPEFQFLP